MITTITLNAALDKTYYLPAFSLGKTNRLRDLHVEPGGKGINVAKVLHTLGMKVTASGFIGGSNGKQIKTLLDNHALPHDFIQIQGESRVCLNIIDEKEMQETEILEAGPVISEDEWDIICDYARNVSKKSKIITLSGSLPQGVPEDGYAQLINMIQKQGAKAILDTSGEALRFGIESAPFAVKPNEHELRQLLNKDSLSFSDYVSSGHLLNKKGIQNVCISLGKNGALFITKDGEYRVKIPELTVVNTVGCGDAMVAGLAAGFFGELSIVETLSLAAACGAANALQPFAGQVDVHDVERILKQIEVVKL